MERLTEMNENGTAHFYPQCFEKCGGMGYSHKCDNCDLLDRACDKLGEYEDLEEQGKLLITPHAVGDTVYTPIFDRMHDPQKYVSEAKIEDVSAKGAVFAGDFVKWEDFGKYEFFTKEAAEAALKEMSE